MSDSAEYVEITAKVKRNDAEYLAQWAGAVGCEVKDVAGDSIEQFLEDWFNNKTEISDDDGEDKPDLSQFGSHETTRK